MRKAYVQGSLRGSGLNRHRHKGPYSLLNGKTFLFLCIAELITLLTSTVFPLDFTFRWPMCLWNFPLYFSCYWYGSLLFCLYDPDHIVHNQEKEYLKLLQYGTKVSLDVKIYSGFSILAVIMIVLPWLAQISYLFTFSLIFLMAACTATLQSSLLGLGSMLPSRYNAAIMTGQGVAGILAGILRISTKATMEGNIKTNALIYFQFAAAILGACLIAYWLIRKRPLVSNNVQLRAYDKAEDSLPLLTDEVTVRDVSNVKKDAKSMETALTAAKIRQNLYELRYYCFVIIFTFAVTFLVFPGVVDNIDYKVTIHSRALHFLEVKNELWWPVLLVFIFNIFDTLGRALPGYWEWSRLVLNTALTVRMILVPCLIGAMQQWTPAVANDISVFVFVSLLAFTNGSCSTMGIVLGPRTIDSKDRELAGFSLSLCPQLGVAIGSLISLSYRQ